MTTPDKSGLIEPLDACHRQHVCRMTMEYIARAEQLYDREFPTIPVLFDLKGRAAGMHKVNNNARVSRYNPYIFAKYFDDNLATTVPHEVAHYIVDMMYNARSVKPHGREWRLVMHSFGVEAKATGNYDLSGIPVRKYNRHAYQCGCTTHQISSARHNKIVQGKARYYCRRCKSTLVPIQAEK